MKKFVKIILMTSMLMLAFAISSFAQCEAKKISIPKDGITLTGKTGSCARFTTSITEGQKVTISLTSADGKTRFELQDGAEDETGAKVYSNRISFADVLTFTEFAVEVKGANSTDYTLKITVTDE